MIRDTLLSVLFFLLFAFVVREATPLVLDAIEAYRVVDRLEARYPTDAATP